jgi:hypothetical protein
MNMTTENITARTAKGAAGKTARAINKMTRQIGGGDEVFAWVRPNENSAGSYDVVWEEFSPFEWPIKATCGQGIWYEVAVHAHLPFEFRPSKEATFNFEQDGWFAEPVNHYVLAFHPIKKG